MDEAVAGQEGEAAAGAPSVAPLDLTNVRGFQVLSGVGEAASAALPEDEEARRRELAKEFAARATRFAESVDDAIVLASDGTIRWLGDPVARLIAGDDTLKPRALVLADEALSAEGREAVERRVGLWIAAHVGKTLGPLLALAAPESVPEPVRDLALKLSQSLGILERERVKTQVKALDQNARGALRKLGVRFGAHYLYVPALLKPGARALCAQLWGLSRGEASREAAAEKLLHFAASGRTSFAVEPPASGEIYRVAGFRLCGDRAVRVDIVERLSDLIRAALPRHAPTEPADANLVGFAVTNQMTSLTGCSGEHFASILRSLGFANHQVNKAAYLAASRKAAEAAAPAPAVAVAASPDEPAAAVAPAEAAAQAPEPAADVAPEEGDGSVALLAQHEPEAERLEGAPEDGENSHDAPPEATTQVLEPATDVAAEDGDASVTLPTASENNVERLDGAAEDGEKNHDAIPDATAPEDPPAPGAASDELIEIWRPAPRRPRHFGRDQERPPRHSHAGAPREDRAPQEGPPRKSWRERQRQNGPRPEAPEGERAAAPPHAGASRPAGDSGRDNRRPPWRRDGAKGPRFEEPRKAESGGGEKGKPRPQPQPAEPRKPSVNLDSPFAKLLDLKPLLKARDKGK